MWLRDEIFTSPRFPDDGPVDLDAGVCTAVRQDADVHSDQVRVTQ